MNSELPIITPFVLFGAHYAINKIVKAFDAKKTTETIVPLLNERNEVRRVVYFLYGIALYRAY